MSKQHDKVIDIEEIAEMAASGEDISQYFTGQHTAKQQISVDFPLHLLRMIDAECQRLGISRQTWVLATCEEKLRQSNGLEVLNVPVLHR